MRIDVTTRGFTVTPGLRARAEKRLSLALDRYRERIARARVVLADVNGPRGGEDKTCRIELRLRGAGGVRVTAVDADAYTAIDVAAHRAARALSRALDRERAATLELLWLARALSPRARTA